MALLNKIANASVIIVRWGNTNKLSLSRRLLNNINQ